MAKVKTSDEFAEERLNALTEAATSLRDLLDNPHFLRTLSQVDRAWLLKQYNATSYQSESDHRLA